MSTASAQLAELDLGLSQAKRQAVTMALHRLIPGKYRDSCFANYSPKTARQAEALKTVRRFTRLQSEVFSASLLLLGPPGTGKTHFAASIIRRAVELDIVMGDLADHRFVHTQQLFREWRERLKARDEDAFFKSYSTCETLVLDDIVAPRSNDEADTLDWLIEQRYRNGLGFIITANLNLDDLRAALGDRSFDRVREGALLAVLDGQSHRSRFGWEGAPLLEAQT